MIATFLYVIGKPFYDLGVEIVSIFGMCGNCCCCSPCVKHKW